MGKKQNEEKKETRATSSRSPLVNLLSKEPPPFGWHEAEAEPAPSSYQQAGTRSPLHSDGPIKIVGQFSSLLLGLAPQSWRARDASSPLFSPWCHMFIT